MTAAVTVAWMTITGSNFLLIGDPYVPEPHPARWVIRLLGGALLASETVAVVWSVKLALRGRGRAVLAWVALIVVVGNFVAEVALFGLPVI
ncbi:MAG: hypothetical protein JWN46_3757 [Acidimicrobiales bacterium]|nr:hypothetical protein [Acidimicrobiales bacterium]